MLFRLCLIPLLLILTLQIIASGDAIETARENCNRVESLLDTALGCEVHINCLFYSANINCSENTLVELSRTCYALDITTCVDVAVLTTIAIEDAILGFQQIDSTRQLNNSLKAFMEGDYQTAIDFYENVTLSIDYFPHYVLELGAGIIYLRFNNPDVALIQFDKSLNLEFYNAIAFYYRGNTYLQRRNSVRALRDHYMYDLLANDLTKSILPLRSFRIQIPDTEAWNLYPVYTMQSNQDILSVINNTTEPLQPIVVAFLDNDETLVIAEWLDIVAGTETEILFFERDVENPLRYILNINQQDIPDSMASSKTEISIIVSPLMLELYFKNTQATETQYITGIASPVVEEDIRPRETIPACEHIPFSLLEVGVTIQPIPPDMPFTLWDEPIVSTPLNYLDETGKAYQVVDGPFCYDNQIWWQVSNGTVTGWLPEYTSFAPYDFNALPSDYIDQWLEDPPTPLQFLALASD